MVVAQVGVACSLGRQVTTVTVREGARVVLGTTGPETTPGTFTMEGWQWGWYER